MPRRARPLLTGVKIFCRLSAGLLQTYARTWVHEFVSAWVQTSTGQVPCPARKPLAKTKNGRTIDMCLDMYRHVYRHTCRHAHRIVYMNQLGMSLTEAHVPHVHVCSHTSRRALATRHTSADSSDSGGKKECSHISSNALDKQSAMPMHTCPMPTSKKSLRTVWGRRHQRFRRCCLAMVPSPASAGNRRATQPHQNHDAPRSTAPCV